MITGKIKNQVDAIWMSFWTGGITNSIDVLEQMTYLFFMKMLDDAVTRGESRHDGHGRYRVARCRLQERPLA